MVINTYIKLNINEQCVGTILNVEKQFVPATFKVI